MTLKRAVILSISTLLLCSLVGCRNSEKLNNEINAAEHDLALEHLDVDKKQSDEVTDTSLQTDEFVNSKLLKSIEVKEDESKCDIILNGFGRDIDLLEFDYYPEYKTMRISYNEFYGIWEESDFKKSIDELNVEGSLFIEEYYEALVFGGHTIAYDILFKAPIEYTIKSKKDENYLSIQIEKTDDFKNLYSIRTKSFDIDMIGDVYYQITGVLLDMSIENSVILKDEEGYFVHISSFDDKKEAADFILKIKSAIPAKGQDVDLIQADDFLILR